jgi:hypothetical protein
MESPKNSNWILLLGFLTALVTLATAATGLYVSVRSVEVALQNKQDIQDIHISLNSRLSQLLTETRENARAKGVVEGEANKGNEKEPK